MKLFKLIDFFLFIFVLLVSSLAFAASTNSASQNHDTITWYHAHFPPVTIPSGPDAGTGFYDKITNFIVDRLPEYQHTFAVANYQRILHEIESEEKVCCASLYRTPEREKYTAFSIPVVVVLPNGIVARRSDKNLFLPYLNAQKKIELSRILEKSGLKLGVAKGRKYSGGIDEIITQHGGTESVVERAGNDVFQGLLNMLFRKRVDYLIGYPVEAQYLAKQINRENDIIFFPVAETTINITLGHVGCPDTEWGKKVISKIDKILLSHRDTPQFLTFYENWLDKETAEDYRNVAVEYFTSEKSN